MPLSRDPYDALSRIPEITPGFWLTPIAATTLCETAGHAVSCWPTRRFSQTLGRALGDGAADTLALGWAATPARRGTGALPHTGTTRCRIPPPLAPGLPEGGLPTGRHPHPH